MSSIKDRKREMINSIDGLNKSQYKQVANFHFGEGSVVAVKDNHIDWSFTIYVVKGKNTDATSVNKFRDYFTKVKLVLVEPEDLI